MKLQNYMSSKGFSIIFDGHSVRLITKNEIDPGEGLVELPKQLVLWLLQQGLPSPLPITITTLTEEAEGLIDAFVFSPDQKIRYLTLKNLHYTLR